MDRLRPMPLRTVTLSQHTSDTGGDRIGAPALFAGFARRVGVGFAGRVRSIANVWREVAGRVSKRVRAARVVLDFADFAENSFSLEPFSVESSRCDVMSAGSSNDRSDARTVMTLPILPEDFPLG